MVGVALGAHLMWMVTAVVAGCLFGTFFMAFHSTQGPQLGLPQMIQSRPQFGYLGALLVWVVALIAYIGFNAFNQILAAQTMGSLYGTDPKITMVVFSVLSVLIAAAGYDFIHLAQRWVAYTVIAALAVFTVATAVRLQLPASELSFGPFPTVPFIAQFFAAASYQISWSIYVSDYSRYLPRDVGVRPAFLVDVSRGVHRWRLDDAGRHAGGRPVPDDPGDDRAAAGSRPGPARIWQAADARPRCSGWWRSPRSITTVPPSRCCRP